MTLSNGMFIAPRLRTSGPIITISVARIRFLMRRIILRRPLVDQTRGARATLTQIDLAADAITGGSARSIPRPALADMIQGLSRVRMMVDQECRHREGHRHLALQSVHVVHETETGHPGTVALSAPRKWMMRQIKSTYRIIHCTRKTLTSDPSTNRAITTCHHLPTPAPADILTMHTSVSPHETFHHHRKSGMKITTDAHQNPASHTLTSVEKAALVPGQQASNSETSSSTAQHQPLPQTHHNTQRRPHHHHHHEVRPALGTT